MGGQAIAGDYNAPPVSCARFPREQVFSWELGSWLTSQATTLARARGMERCYVVVKLGEYAAGVAYVHS